MRAYVWAKPRKDPYKHRVNGESKMCPSIPELSNFKYKRCEHSLMPIRVD